MGYYIRFLSTSTKVIPFRRLQADIAKEGLSAVLRLEGGSEQDWKQLILSHPDGPEIAVIERDLVEDGSLGKAEIEEFTEMISDEEPQSAVGWLQEFLPWVKVIYSFQLLSGTDIDNGWEAVHGLRDLLWPLGGIMQADGEGFSNEEGYHILWQFSENVEGLWWMGILHGGKWIQFQMDLGNKKHREAFQRGEVPQGVRLA